MSNEIKKIEEEQEYESISENVPPSDIIAFNEMRSCLELVRLSSTNQLEIKPDFQRDVVWQRPAQTRFIDSLTKQLPIPSMCISLDSKTDKRLIIDGLQRMQSMIYFLTNDDWELSKLDDINERLSGKKVSTIKNESDDIYKRVQNIMIPITVIRCDYSKKSHNEYLFTIFHRLNSGGMRLNNQEIRNCIYSGILNESLKKLANRKDTKAFFGVRKRFSNEEMILRFFAFTDEFDKYNGKLASFLNNYMFENRTKVVGDNAYVSSLDIIEKMIKHPSKTFSKTVLEGLLYGVSQNIETLTNQSHGELKILFENFKSLPEYSPENLKSALSDKDKVKERLLSAKNCFAL
ncbi:MAG: DUF262 domain-containing protein [Methylobacter sp.]|jgi:hypothetical protein|nr:DUF262 domain-containing protein [Methylobacter sp.]